MGEPDKSCHAPRHPIPPIGEKPLGIRVGTEPPTIDRLHPSPMQSLARQLVDISHPVASTGAGGEGSGTGRVLLPK